MLMPPRSLKAKSEAIAKAQAEGRTETEVAELVQDLASTNLQSTSDAAADKLATEFDDDIETGFQLACHQGPLCAEPVVGMAYFVEKVAININEENEDACESHCAAFLCSPALTSALQFARDRVKSRDR